MKIIHYMKVLGMLFLLYVTLILCHGIALQIYPVICFHILYCFQWCVYQCCCVIIHIPVFRPSDVVDKGNAAYNKMTDYYYAESIRTSNESSQRFHYHGEGSN